MQHQGMKDMHNQNCPSCVYENGKFIKYCGFCEEKNISTRIKWWQDGKKKLRSKGVINKQIYEK